MRVDETRCTGAAAKHCGDPTIPGTADIACTSIGPLSAFILGLQGILIDFLKGSMRCSAVTSIVSRNSQRPYSKQTPVRGGHSKDARLLEDNNATRATASTSPSFQLEPLGV